MTQVVYARVVLDVHVELCRLRASQMLALLRLKQDSDQVLGLGKLYELYCQEIVPKVRHMVTVPKPTQVGEMNILRRSS